MAAIYTCDRCGEVKKTDELREVCVSFDDKEYNGAYQLGLKGLIPRHPQRYSVCVRCRAAVNEQFKFSKVDDYNIQAKD